MDLYQTNIYDLQAKELIDGIIPKKDVKDQIQSLANEIKEIICLITETEERPLIEYINEFEEEKTPYIYPPGLKNEGRASILERLKVRYIPPAGPLVVGSYIADHSIGDETTRCVDIMVPIPEILFQEKDFKNYRYFLKRNFYLCKVASAINQKKGALNVKLKYFLEPDLNRVSILIFPDNQNHDSCLPKLKFHFKILFGTIEPPFPASKLAPNKSNLKIIDNNPTTIVPSPFYNSSISIDSSYINHIKYVEQAKSAIPSITGAIILSKIWLYLRLGYKLSSNKFNGFILTFLIIHLTSSSSIDHQINKSMSSFQIFRSLLKYISECQLKNNILIAENPGINKFNKDLSKPPINYELFSQFFDVVMLDPTGEFNLCSFVSKYDFFELKHHAMLSLECLQKYTEVEAFKKLLLEKHSSFGFDYDFTIIAQCPDLKDLPQIDSPGVEFIPKYELFRINSLEMFYNAMPGRIKLAVVDYRKKISWDINSTLFLDKRFFSSSSIFYSFIFNYTECTKAVLKGPALEDKVATEKLKKWWEDKLKVRIFNDGYTWNCVELEKRQSVNDNLVFTIDMIQYLINTKLNINNDAINVKSDTINAISGLLIPKGYPNKVNAFNPLIVATNTFSKNLCNLDSLPLRVKTVIPFSPSYRYTSTFVTQPYMSPATCVETTGYANIYQDPNCVLMRLETSSGWPGTLEAIRLTKQAFYMKIAHEYSKKYPQAISRVCIGQNKGYKVLEDYLEVVIPEGYPIRAYFVVSQEKTIIQKKLNSLEIDDEERKILKGYLREYIHVDRHLVFYSARIKALCTKYRVLSQTIRLTKRWLSAHMLLTHIPEEIVELICASIFVNSAPLSPPTCVFSSFVRVLQFIASWDVFNEPLIVELLSESLSPSDHQTIRKNFKETTNNYYSKVPNSFNRHPPCMLIYHEENLTGDWWCEDPIPPQIVQRIKSLAKVAFERCSEIYFSNLPALDVLSEIFTTSYDYFDAFITLDPQMISRYTESLTYSKKVIEDKHSKYRNISRGVTDEEMITCSIDVVSCYVNTIKSTIGSSCTLFVDNYGGQVIGIKWDRQYCSETKFNANLDFVIKPPFSTDLKRKKHKLSHAESSEKVTPNFTAMLCEMFNLGEGLAKAVYFKPS